MPSYCVGPLPSRASITGSFWAARTTRSVPLGACQGEPGRIRQAPLFSGTGTPAPGSGHSAPLLALPLAAAGSTTPDGPPDSLLH